MSKLIKVSSNIQKVNMQIAVTNKILQRSKVYWKKVLDKLKEEEKWEELMGKSEEAIQIMPNFAYGYYRRGAAKYHLNDFEGVIEDCNIAIDLQPNFALAYCNRGLAKKDLDKHKEALNDYNRAIELDSKCIPAYENRASVNHELEDYEEALKDCNIAIELGCKNADIYAIRAIIKYELDDYEGALKDLDFFTSQEEVNTELLVLAYKVLIWTDMSNEYYTKAINNCTKILVIDSKDEEIYFLRAQAKYELKDYKGAIEDYHNAIKLNPTNNDEKRYLELAELYYFQSNEDYKNNLYFDAIDNLKLAIKWNSELAKAYANRGYIYRKLGKYREALNDFVKAKELDAELHEIDNFIDSVKNRL